MVERLVYTEKVAGSKPAPPTRIKFMLKLNIRAVNLKLEPVIEDYITEKIGGLDKFIERTDTVAQAWVEIGLTTKHHQSGDIYRAEVQIRLSGKGIRGEKTAADLFLAIDAVREELQEELMKYKGKKETLRKRGGRLLRKVFHFSPLARLWRKRRIREEGV